MGVLLLVLAAIVEIGVAISGMNVFAIVLGFLLGIGVLVAGIAALIDYLTISNTYYKVYKNKIESISYLFAFLGVKNNVVNLTQTRKIQGFSNGYLDIWFFHCGKIVITVSGDQTDFVLENIYMAGSVKRQLEEIVFGTPSDSGMQADMEAES